MAWSILELVEGIRCQTCLANRTFGSPPDDRPENLYVYQDLTGGTRCYCIEHMSFCNYDGVKVHHTHESAIPAYGAELKSEIIKRFKKEEE